MAKILDGKPVAKAILTEAAKRAAALHERGIVPALAVIRTRNDGSATAQYEQMALDACAAAGVEAYSAYIPDVRRLRTNVENINRDDSIHGAIFLRPLPGVEAEDLLRAELLPVKDVDGVSFSSLSAIFAGHGRAFAPCPVKAAMELLDYYKIPVEGKRVTLIGSSMVTAKPLSLLLLERGAVVTLCRGSVDNLDILCRESDIVVSGTGIHGLLGAGCFRSGQYVVDVGDSLPGEEHSGDVDTDAALAAGADVAPANGGVNVISFAVLALHTVQAAELQNGLL